MLDRHGCINRLLNCLARRYQLFSVLWRTFQANLLSKHEGVECSTKCNIDYQSPVCWQLDFHVASVHKRGNIQKCDSFDMSIAIKVSRSAYQPCWRIEIDQGFFPF